MKIQVIYVFVSLHSFQCGNPLYPRKIVDVFVQHCIDFDFQEVWNFDDWVVFLLLWRQRAASVQDSVQNQFEHFISLWLSHCAVCGDRGHEEARCPASPQEWKKGWGTEEESWQISFWSIRHQESSMKTQNCLRIGPFDWFLEFLFPFWFPLVFTKIHKTDVVRSNQVPRKRETPGLFTLALESLERELLFGYNAWREELEQRVRGNVEMRAQDFWQSLWWKSREEIATPKIEMTIHWEWEKRQSAGDPSPFTDRDLKNIIAGAGSTDTENKEKLKAAPVTR